MQFIENSLRGFYLIALTVVCVIMLSGCSLEPKPKKSDTIQALLDEIRLIGSNLSSENSSEAAVSYERANSLFSELHKAKEDNISTSEKACNIMMANDLRELHRLYKYALDMDRFANERHAIGTIRDITVSKYGDCALTKEIYEEAVIAKSLTFEHLDSIFPNESETFEERYKRIVNIQRIRETEAFTAWYSMGEAEKKKYEGSASVRACLDAATKNGSIGISLSELQSACRQGLR